MTTLRTTYTFAELEISPSAYNEIKRKLKAAKYDHAFHDEGKLIDMHGIALTCPSPKKRVKGGMITGKELRFAAKHKIPVYYVETYYSPTDKYMNYRGKSVMTKISTDEQHPEYYIGRADINVNMYKDDHFVSGDFPEGEFAVYKLIGYKYK